MQEKQKKKKKKGKQGNFNMTSMHLDTKHNVQKDPNDKD